MAFGEGLISEQTFAARLDHVLNARLIDAEQVVGDIRFRRPRGRLRERLSQTVTTLVGHLDLFASAQETPTLLALDWSGQPHELVIGRSSRCDVRLRDPTVSRRHARLIFRDGRWVFQDLASTNGSVLNGRRVGRCEVRPGDRLRLGTALLRVD